MNTKLWTIRRLLIANSKMDEMAVGLFGDFLERLKNENCLRLEYLDLTHVGRYYEDILKCIDASAPPLRSLLLGKADLSQPAFDALLDLLDAALRLREVAIDGTGLTVAQIIEVMRTIVNNTSLSEMSLDLSDLNLNGINLGELLPLLVEVRHRKWVKFSFDRNGLNVDDFRALVNGLREFHKLRGLSIGGNFPKSDPRIPSALTEVLNIGTLKSLSLKGSNVPLRSALFPLIDALAANERITVLNISQNKIGADGYQRVSQMLTQNRTLSDLQIDGSFTADVTEARFCEFMDSLAKSRLVFCEFPRQDACALIQSIGAVGGIVECQRCYHIAFERKQTDAGYHSDLNRRNMRELNALLDNVTRAVRARLRRATVRQHRSATSVFGLPMPFLAEDQQHLAREWNIGEETTVEETVYGLEHATWMVTEDEQEEDGSRQFRALRKRTGEAEVEADARDERASLVGDVPELEDEPAEVIEETVDVVVGDDIEGDSEKSEGGDGEKPEGGDGEKSEGDGEKPEEVGNDAETKTNSEPLLEEEEEEEDYSM